MITKEKDNIFDDCSVEIQGKSFLFTGKLTACKVRKVLEKKISTAGGLVKKTVNKTLDYLVVGSKGSPTWKYGSSGGTKIEQAIKCRQKGYKPLIIREDQLINELRSQKIEIPYE